MLSVEKFIFFGALLILPSVAIWDISFNVGWKPTICYVFAVSLVTLLLNRSDKKRARTDKWRIKETTLHLLEFMGGWPVAYITQRIIHHKTFKIHYQIWFWMIVVLYQIASIDYLNKGKLMFFVLSKIGYIMDFISRNLVDLTR